MIFRIHSVVFSAFITTFLLLSPLKVIAHAGHGDEFKSNNSKPKDAIQVDANAAKQIGIKVEPVTRQQLSIGIKTNGQIEALPDRVAQITTPIRGKIVNILVKPGDLVAPGQVLALMTSPDVVERRVESLERRVEAEGNQREAQANLTLALQNADRVSQIAQAEIREEQARLKLAQERYDRDQELATQGVIASRRVTESAAELAQAKANLVKAQSQQEVIRAQAEVIRARSVLQVTQERVGLSETPYRSLLSQLGAKTNEDGTISITSPIGGVVSELKATLSESGEDAGKSVMTIVNNNQLLATANIYEKDLQEVSVGQEVKISVGGRFYKGKVKTIGATVNTETRVVPVQAEIENSDRTLTVGMFAELEILTTKSTESVLTIPMSAVVEANGSNLVFVQNGNTFQPVEVLLGRTSGDYVEVDQGLYEGDMIATQRATQLYAQSLRSGSKTTEPAPKSDEIIESNFFLLPWSMLLGGAIGGGAIVAGAFWLGRKSGTKMVILREPELTSNFPSADASRRSDR